MSNIMLMPEAFANLEKEELLHAFFGYYYETIIAVNDDNVIDEIIGYVRTSLKYTETTNDMLWKHMWLSYCSFVMRSS